MMSIEKLKTKWPIVAGLGGGFVAGLIDIITNEEAAFTFKISRILFKQGVEVNALWPLLVVAIISGFIIWGMETDTRKQAMIQGLSILSILTVITPYKNEGIHGQKLESSSIENSLDQAFHVEFASNISDQMDIVENATIIENKWISSTKPETTWKSFFNNSILVKEKDHNLKSGDRVEIIDCWDTPLRGYRYIKIKYNFKNKIDDGWIWSGKGPEYWFAVKPDKADVCRK